MPTPEEQAREKIDWLSNLAGWIVQDYKQASVRADRGVVLRNFPLGGGYGSADYVLYIHGKAARVIEAKKEGHPLTAMEIQAEKYSKGLPDNLPAYIRPLPSLYQSTGVETRFANELGEPSHGRVSRSHWVTGTTSDALFGAGGEIQCR